MEVINRLLASLDPDLWDYNDNFYVPDYICAVKNNLKDNFKLLPSKACKHIFSFLKLEDLKNCRSVCHYWNQVIRPIFQKRTCFILDGEKYKWKFFLDGTCKKYHQFMSTCSSKFSLWSSMRIRKVSTDQLNFLIENYEFGHAVKHISSLELVECQLEWRVLMGFLRHFESLESLEDIKCLHFFQEPLFQKLKSFFVKSEVQASNTMSMDFPARKSSFWKLRRIRIIENDIDNSVTEELFNILNSRTGAIDEVELDIGQQTSAIESPHRQTEYWSNILYCLRMKDVKRLTIKSSHPFHNGFSKRFLLYFSHWKGNPGTSFSKLTELVIKIQPIQLWKTFQDQFIPFVRTLKLLEKFSIQMIMMRESQEHLLHSLKKAVPKACSFEFGLIIDDYGGLIAASQIQTSLLQQLYFENLTTLDVVIVTDIIIEARELFPYGITLQTTFPRLKNLCFSTKLRGNTSFYTYNLDIVVQTFPNLTQIVINDGPTTNDSNEQRSGAILTDQDIQLILEHLYQLQKLDFRVSMVFVTDAGMTGLFNPSSKLECYSQSKMRVHILNAQRFGYSFSNLKYLRYLSLEGLGNRITDKTAFNAFNGLQHSLRSLSLIGMHKITEVGQEYLTTEFSSNGCVINFR